MIKTELEYYNLINQMRQWQKAYDEGQPQISDKQWDEYYKELLDFEWLSGKAAANSPTQIIDYQVVNKLEKVEHNHPMLSLQKSKELEDIRSFVKDHDWIAMAKMDGLTCSLYYRGGRLVRAETRGNGFVGEDITHNARVIPSIPKNILCTKENEEVIVDGEIICTYEDFESFKEEYANPRNFAAGSIRLLDSRECANRKLTFIAWDLIKGYDVELLEKEDTLSNKLEMLYVLGFKTVPWIAAKPEDNYNVDEAAENIQSTCRIMSYPIDGLVFKYNDCEEYVAAGSTDHHPRGGMAYKFYDELYETELTGIEWQQGRTGVFTPVAIFKEVDTGDSLISRASLHNIGIMNQLLGQPFVGQKIRIFKSNLIIPQVYDAEPSKYSVSLLRLTHCPTCGAELVLKNNDGILTLWCPNAECEGKLINKLEHFCGKKGLDIKGISKATLEKLMEWNWVNQLIDIFSLKEHRQEWINKEGFGAKSVDKILEAIESAKNCSAAAFISSLGIPLIGSTVAKDLIKEFDTYEEFRKAVAADFNFSVLPSFGPEKDRAIKTYDYAQADEISKLLTFVSAPAAEQKQTLNGLTFVCTGKLSIVETRAKLKEIIEQNGGKLTDSISAKTNYLINNDITSSSAKNKAAQSKGIPIITEQQFLDMLI